MKWPGSVALALALTGAALSPDALQTQGLKVPDSPSALAASADGRLLFVGIDRRFGRGGEVDVYRRDGMRFEHLARALVPSGVQSIALTRDGRVLGIANRVGIGAFSVAALLANTVKDVEITRDGGAPATSQVVTSADGRYLYYTNAGTAALGIARIEQTDDPLRFHTVVVGHVSLDRSPSGIALSADGKTLYVTSEVQRGALPGEQDSRLARERCASNLGPSGTLSIIDAEKLPARQSEAVAVRVAAGCGPVRVSLAPDGKLVWVSVRGENRVIAFVTARVRTDPRHALVASVPVGPVPIGLAESSDGRYLLVANSHRGVDPDGAASPGDLSVISVDAALVGAHSAVATIPSAALPREVLPLQNETFLIADFDARLISVLNIADIPLKGNDEP